MEQTVQEQFDALVAKYGAPAVTEAIKGHVHPNNDVGCKKDSDCPIGYYCHNGVCILDVG